VIGVATTEHAVVDRHVNHRDITGGWLRPAVFGLSDGLVSNVALVSGVAGGGAGRSFVVLAGLAGLLAGAFSMAIGEYTSVRSQQELAHAELAIERRELERSPDAEQAELAGFYRQRGLSARLAHEVSVELSRDPEVAWRVHAREELGIDPDSLPSPWLAAIVSFFAFQFGALVPLLPYLLGAARLVVAVIASGVALFATGVAVSRFTKRSAFYTGVRQLALGGAAALITFLIGRAIGVGVS
jgi:VIT1/CCC1 family predicted Fe2+/Mn2+ transporter